MTQSSRKSIIAQRIRAKEYIRNLRAEMAKGYTDKPYATAHEQMNAAREQLSQTLYFLERTE